jgi:hypothetical protein
MKLKNNYPSVIDNYFGLLVFFILLLASFAFSASNYVYAQEKKEFDLLLPENKDIRGKNNFTAPHILELIQFIEEDLNIQFNKKFLPWNRAIAIAQQTNQLIFGLSQTESRLQLFNFSEPAIHHYIWLITLKENQFDFKSLQDLKGKRIGILRGSFYGGEFDKQRNQLFQVEDDINSIEARVEKLHNRRMDSFILSSIHHNSKDVERHIGKILQTNQKINSTHLHDIAVLEQPVLKDDMRFALRKGGQSDLLPKINSSLEKYHRTHKKYR